MLENLGVIIEQLKARAGTDEDRERLDQILSSNLFQEISQSGKYNVALDKGTNVHIGDRVHQGFSIEDVKTLIQLLQIFKTPETIVQHSDAAIEDEQLEELKLDAHLVEQINLRLTAIEEIDRVDLLPESYRKVFKTLKAKVKSLKDINRELEEITRSAEQLLQEAIAAKLQELTSLQQKPLTEANSKSCLEQRVDFLSQFQFELEQGKKVARWLDQKRTNLAKAIGQQALDAYPEIKKAISSRQLSAFYLSLEQFLERLSHCLKWGRYNSLDAPRTPVVLDDEVYKTAFTYLKNQLPKHLPDEGVNQLKDYIDYLLENLPSYQHLSLG